MLKDLLEQGTYSSEYNEQKKAYVATTPSGIIGSYQAKYPDLEWKTDLDEPTLCLLLAEVERMIQHYHESAQKFTGFLFRYKTICLSITNGAYFSMATRNYFFINMSGFHVAGVLPSKKLQCNSVT